MDIQYDENFVYVDDETIPAYEFMSLNNWKRLVKNSSEGKVISIIRKILNKKKEKRIINE